ncbi:MAG TPA: hypothetical protein VM889_03760 [Candidatus Thermoplasmatota archaeon]|nr:hypothetical protein [Candidatus Thermoplasmatota archaeon]
MPSARRVLLASVLAAALLTPGCINLGSPAAEYRGFDPTAAPHPNVDLSKPSKPPPTPASPTQPPPAQPSAPAKPDPGLVVTASWRVGDSWTYRAVSGPLLGSETTVSIVGYAKRGSAGMFIQKTELKLRNQPQAYVTYAGIDAATHGVANITGDKVRFTHSPPDPGPRFLRNGTYNFTVTRTDDSRTEFEPSRTTTYVKNATVRLVGPIKLKTEAGTFDTVQFTTRTSVEGSRAEPAVTHRWYSPKVLNDVFVQKGDGGERLELVRYHLAPR